jgi:hypothetical protein
MIMENLTIGQRIAVTFIIVLAILFALALFGYLTGGWEVEAQVPRYEISKYEGEMLAIEHKAIDEAFHNQVVNVFAVWMKDNTGQPGRAINGVVQARKAYIASKTRLEERDAEYKRSLEGK